MSIEDVAALAGPDEESMEAVATFMEQNGFVWTHALQDPLSQQRSVYVTLHVCKPSDASPMFTLFTTGMSNRAMAVPSHEDRAHIELVIHLPPDWPGAEGPAPNDPRLGWVVFWLKELARYPHEEAAWLGPGHLIPTGDDPLPGTGFTGFVLLHSPALPFPPEVVTTDGRTIAMYLLMPLYPEEIEFKRMHGTPALLERFSIAGVTEVADPHRPNVGLKAEAEPS